MGFTVVLLPGMLLPGILLGGISLVSILLAEGDTVLGLVLALANFPLPLDQSALLCPVAADHTRPISCTFYIPLK